MTASRISRRSALRLAAGAGAAIAAAPYLSRATGSALRAVDLRGARPAAVMQPDWPAPVFVTRAQWGADESIREPGQEYDPVVEKLVIHHTATPNDADPIAAINGIYRTAVAGEYIDVPYNWLIDNAGTIYEGRWAKDYAPGELHAGEANGQSVRSAHALFHNARSIGIAFLGTYTNAAPSPAAINALLSVLTWKCARWGIDPRGATAYTTEQGVVETSLFNICGHRDTYATICPGLPLENMLPALRDQVASRLADGTTGYWIASSMGQLLAFGNLPDQGDTRRAGIPTEIVGLTAHPSGLGYWMFARDGGVFTFGNARFLGSTGDMRLNKPVVGMAPTVAGSGYWLVAQDGGVFSFGDARFFGSTGALRLNAPMLGMCPTPSGNGYWLYARDGGIFSFGDAQFFGSTGNLRLNKPIITMAARPQGDGYWLIAEDGGVFAFGGAPFFGSTANVPKSAPVVSMSPTTTGNGYVLLLRDGGVFTFGDAPFLGSASGRLSSNAVGLAGRLKPA